MKIKYWFTGDYHLGHNNILKLSDRPFSIMHEMVETLISNHNSMVAKDDIVYNLGDVGYKCSSEYIATTIKRFNGQQIIILGNHDKSLRKAIKEGRLDKEINSQKITILGGMESVNDPDLSISKLIELEGNTFFISHYGHRTWPHAFRNCIHLFAHSHGNLPSLYKSMDVGVDTNNFFPYSMSDILSKMSKKTESFSENTINKELNA